MQQNPSLSCVKLRPCLPCPLLAARPAAPAPRVRAFISVGRKCARPLLPFRGARRSGARMSKSANRSFERITDIDLRRLSALAAADFDDLFRRNARWRPYRRRLLLLCLCAALHYASPRRGTAADRIGGVNDFDVWGFFADWPNGRPFPPRRHGFQDFGPSKFGEARRTSRASEVVASMSSADRSRSGPAKALSPLFGVT